MKLKMFEEFIDDDLDYEEEQDDVWMIIGWIDDDGNDNYRHHWNSDDWVYILQEEIDENKIIIYNNIKYDMNNIKRYYTPLTNEELEKYIYSNKKKILIHGGSERPDESIYYKDLPAEVKNKL